jgi:hypothetical protein
VADPDGSRAVLARDEFRLNPVFAALFHDLGEDAATAARLAETISVAGRLPLPSSVIHLPPLDRAPALARAIEADEAVGAYIGVNLWQGVSWFNRESFEQLLWWMLALDTLQATAMKSLSKTEVTARVAEADRLTLALAQAGEASGYQLDKLESAAGTAAGTADKPD